MDTLQKYGNTFQNKVIAAMLADRVFLQQVSDMLDPKYLSSDAGQWLVKATMKYFAQYKTAPTLDTLKIEIDSIDVDVLKTTVVENLRDVWKFIESDDLPYVKDQILAFCKNQKLKNAILKSVELLKEARYDEIKMMVDDAMKAGSDRNVGHTYIEDVAERFKVNKRSTIKTPWEVVNEIMDGGLGGGELGVFVAPAGIGKSMALVNIAAYAAQQGLNVIYYTLELNETYVGSRFDSFYTGIPSQDLKFHQTEVEEAVADLKGKLVIKYFPTKTATVSMLAAHVEKCTLQGVKPDIILVDYADLLRDVGAKTAARHDIMLSNIYEDLRGMAGTLQVPIWTASQANRSALEEDIIEADKIAESYSKVMIADFVVSLSRKTTDKISGTGRYHIIKNRFGPDGLTFPSKMNMSVCKIQIFAENTLQGKEANKVMQNSSEVIRKTLQNKFQELQGLV
jgi:replicative DNA helicase